MEAKRAWTEHLEDCKTCQRFEGRCPYLCHEGEELYGVAVEEFLVRLHAS